MYSFFSYFWGNMSDRLGRRPVMLSSLCFLIITNVLFGFSVNIYMAMVLRFLGGLFNGMIFDIIIVSLFRPVFKIGLSMLQCLRFIIKQVFDSSKDPIFCFQNV